MYFTTNKTKLLGLVGTPIEHTISPEMHSIMSSKYGYDFSYLAFDVKNGDLKDAIAAMRAMNFRGLNITAPYKIDVMDLIDEIDYEASAMGSVNTVVNTDGILKGYNTDGDGFVNSLIFEGTEVKNKKVLMLGAGGAARSLAFKLAKNGISEIHFSARSADKIRVITDVIEKNTDVKTFDFYNKTVAYDIIINTTPLGMYPDISATPFSDYDMLNEGATVCDIIYNPQKTVLLKNAEKRGAKIVNGLSMLVLQGVYAFEYFADFVIDDKMEMYTHLMNNFSSFNISTKGKR